MNAFEKLATVLLTLRSCISQCPDKAQREYLTNVIDAFITATQAKSSLRSEADDREWLHSPSPTAAASPSIAVASPSIAAASSSAAMPPPHRRPLLYLDSSHPHPSQCLCFPAERNFLGGSRSGTMDASILLSWFMVITLSPLS